MAKEGFLNKDSFAALFITLVFILAIIFDVPVLKKLEYAAYDLGVRMTNRHAGAAEDIAVVAIDDASIASLGPWPWSRGVLAEGLAPLNRARVVGLQLPLNDAQNAAGLAQVRQVQAYVNDSRLPKLARRETREITALLRQAERELNTDQRLAAVLAQMKNVMLPLTLRNDAPAGSEAPEFVRRHRITPALATDDPRLSPAAAASMTYPLEMFATHAAGLGHTDILPDTDGTVRSVPLLRVYQGDAYPSLAVRLAAAALRADERQLNFSPGGQLQLGRRRIDTAPHARLYSGFYRPGARNKPYAVYSFADVRDGKVPGQTFADKIVIVGISATEAAMPYATPVARRMSLPELSANVVASLLNEDYYTRPDWAPWAEMALVLAVLVYLVLALPALSSLPATLLSLGYAALLLGGGHYLLISQQLWLKTAAPALLLLVGHAVLIGRRHVVSEDHKVKVASDSAHTNRMLGLSFQGQGQLDMALDKFRSLPVDESVLDLIYNLALDFERKRQYNKAEAAYDYIVQRNPTFRDATTRRTRAHQAGSVPLADGSLGAANGGARLSGGDQKPTLGRYEIEKKLGKGSMGTVYLGRDPKINRVVAIKTLALSQEFEGEELARVKARFFREAETAGRLNHPNIVTIYDVGEEHDLAYIAMEYLEGHDLTRYCQPDSLLAMADVAHIIGKVALALAYAHSHEVVHRDIKPANVMYNPATGSVKVTDFGIARITANSNTKTGVVLGSPAYMSPEQLAGKVLDGRSDLFSLGITLFELLAGQQPFQGETMATLMYQIANETHPDITQLRADLPVCLKALMDQVLAKNPDQRFQSGETLHHALDICLGGTLDIDLGDA
jgi:serine/threonine-protein kinase